jgi:hypothetical protein
MHGTSFFGVSFTRLLHADDDTAFALEGTRSAAATRHSGASHRERGAMGHLHEL